jgi:hypothetical protein
MHSGELGSWAVDASGIVPHLAQRANGQGSQGLGNAGAAGG